MNIELFDARPYSIYVPMDLFGCIDSLVNSINDKMSFLKKTGRHFGIQTFNINRRSRSTGISR